MQFCRFGSAEDVVFYNSIKKTIFVRMYYIDTLIYLIYITAVEAAFFRFFV